MKYNPDIHHRRSIRLARHDYARRAAYLVTICTHGCECFFGEVVDGEMRLNDMGRTAQSVWEELPRRFPGITLDRYVVMPNHVHGIAMLSGVCLVGTDDAHVTGQGVMNHAPTEGGRHSVGAQFIAPNPAPTPAQTPIGYPPALGEVIRAFKAETTRTIRLSGVSQFGWQRNYYEHIIPNRSSLGRVREYIAHNPLRWQMDEFHPDSTLEEC